MTATCASTHIDRIRALGADRVIDYSVDDFTQDPARYDVVFDAVGKSTFGRCRPLLKPRGVYISSELGPCAQNPLLALVTPLLVGKKVAFPTPFNPQASLDVITGLLAKRAFNPLIDRTFPLEEIQDAFKLTLSGEKIGNVVLTLNQKSARQNISNATASALHHMAVSAGEVLRCRVFVILVHRNGAHSLTSPSRVPSAQPARTGRSTP